MDKHSHFLKHRMLDTGCGDGRFLEFWTQRYDKVDMFDQCNVAKGMVENKIQELKLQDRASVVRSSFVDFPWQNYLKFDLIFMCHTTGYMEDDQLLEFLTEAGNKLCALDLDEAPTAVKDVTNSVICILDNICEEGSNMVAKRQRVRSSKDFEALFDKAGLQIAYSTEETVVREEFLKMRIWLLSKRVTVKATILDNVPENKLDDGREEEVCDS